MNGPVSGVWLFLLYAFPCAEDRLRAGKITEIDFEKLRWLIGHKKEPGASLLERCFPAAVEDYRKTCEDIGILSDFSLQSVAYHWRYSHSRTGNCAVRFGTITEICPGNNVVKVSETGPLYILCLNPYSLELKPQDQVTFHRLHIVEKID